MKMNPDAQLRATASGKRIHGDHGANKRDAGTISQNQNAQQKLKWTAYGKPEAPMDGARKSSAGVLMEQTRPPARAIARGLHAPGKRNVWAGTTAGT